MRGQIITDAVADASFFTTSEAVEAPKTYQAVGLAMRCNPDPDNKTHPPAESVMIESAAMGTLRSSLSPKFGTLFQSLGDEAITTARDHILLQTIGASPLNPYVVNFCQFIIDPFTGDGQFDLVEREAVRRVRDGVAGGKSPVLTSETMSWVEDDEGKNIKVEAEGSKLIGYFKILSVDAGNSITLSGDILYPATGLILTMDGEAATEVTLATKDGFTDGDTTGGWSRFAKVITSDKIYTAIFVPGDAGDGAFSLTVEPLTERRQ